MTPEQAAEVAHASQEGEITLALRNDLDGQFPETTGVVVNDLIEKLRPPAPVRKIIKREQKSTNTNAIIRFIRGSSVETRSVKTK